MPQSLRSILGNSNRVRKPSRQTSSSSLASSTTSPRKQQRPSSSSPSPRKPRGEAAAKKRKKQESGEDSQDSIIFDEKLDDVGTAQLLNDLTLRDVVQAMRYVRRHMFDPVPERGFTSTRTTELLNYRATFPPIVTLAHLHALLDSPTATEREAVDLLARGIVRRVRIERRGGQGEALIETPELLAMLDSSSLSSEARERFARFLRENPTAKVVPRDALTDRQADELIRVGFLTSANVHSQRGDDTLHMRPEERVTLTSIQRVSQFASGSISAVGGPNALHLAGGGGGGGGPPGLMRSASSSSASSFGSDLKIAIPGHGRYLKLAAATIEWLREALGRTKFGECPETWLKERFESGGLYGTRWKEFSGVRWEWVLGQAVGLGVVEIFETGSVGKGIRALG